MFGREDPVRGAALAQARRQRPMTQEALALAAGVSAQTVKRAEAGRSVSAETVLALCSALGIVPQVLAEVPEEPRLPIEVAPDVTGRARRRPLAFLRSVPSDAWWALIPSALLFATAFTPLAGGPILFRYLVLFPTVLTAFCATVSCGRWTWSNRCAPRTRYWSRCARGTFAASAILCLTTAHSIPALYRDYGTWTATADADIDEVGREWRITNRMVADDPRYDRVLDDYYLLRAGEAALGSSDPSLDTPGAYKARVALEARCRDDWWNAPVYDHARCEPRRRARGYDRLVEFVRAFVGGSVGDRRDQDEARARFTDHRYDGARVEVAHGVAAR